MAFKRTVDTKRASESYIGTDGIDKITTNTKSRNKIWLEALKGNDSVVFNTDLTGRENLGPGDDVFRVGDITDNRLTGDSGDDIIRATSSVRSTAQGGSGNDIISIDYTRSDYVEGNEGNDTLAFDAFSASSVYGGQGNDYLRFRLTLYASLVNCGGGADFVGLPARAYVLNSVLLGDEGNDIFSLQDVRLFTGSSIFGGNGDDTIDAAQCRLGIYAIGDGNKDRIIGGSGKDSLFGGTGEDSIQGGAGDDVIGGGWDNDTLTGGSGIDSFQVDIHTDWVTDLGDGGNDEIDVGVVSSGTTIANVTVTAPYTAQANSSNGGRLNATASVALPSNSLISFQYLTGNGVKLAGNDSGLALRGSANNDTISGGASADTLDGLAGTDTLSGGNGNDSLIGGSNVDSFQVGAGNDVIADLGDGGNDEIDVASGAIAYATVTSAYTAQSNSSNAGTLHAYSSATLSSGSLISFQYLTGNGVNLTGNSLGLVLTGSGQVDAITGGTGVDVLTGGSGDDNIAGGTSGDRFVLQTTQQLNGTDTITDFNVAQSDNVSFAFGDGGLESQAALRGTGAYFERLSASAALGANTGLVISSASIPDSASAKIYAEGLTGEASGDIIYLLASTNAAAAASGEVSIYQITYSDIGSATSTKLAAMGTFVIADVTAAQIAQFSLAPAVVI